MLKVLSVLAGQRPRKKRPQQTHCNHSYICTRGRQTRFPRTSLCTEQVGLVFHSRGSTRSGGVCRGKERRREGAALVHPCLCQLCLLLYVFLFFFSSASSAKRRSSHTQTAWGGVGGEPGVSTWHAFAGRVPIHRWLMNPHRSIHSIGISTS